MKKLFFILLSVLFLTACGQTTQNKQEAVYVNITAQQAKELMDTENDYIIIDARTDEEFSEIMEKVADWREQTSNKIDEIL